MAYLLDTSVAILLRDGQPEIVDRVDALDSRPLLSVVARVELESGVYRDPHDAPLLRERLDLMLAGLDQIDFRNEDAVAYGRIVAELGYSRRQVADRMIAAQTIVVGATLATLNPRDFQGISHLQLDDWSV